MWGKIPEHQTGGAPRRLMSDWTVSAVQCRAPGFLSHSSEPFLYQGRRLSVLCATDGGVFSGPSQRLLLF